MSWLCIISLTVLVALRLQLAHFQDQRRIQETAANVQGIAIFEV